VKRVALVPVPQRIVVNESRVASYFIPVGHVAKLTEPLIRQMIRHIENLLPTRDACFLIGLFENTHYRWMKVGKNFIESSENSKMSAPDEKNRKYADYFIRINRALARMHQKLISRSFEPDKLNPSWVRDMTILERRDRSEWAKLPDGILTDKQAEYDPDESFV